MTGVRETDSAAVEARAATLAFGALALGAVAMGASPIFVRLAEVGPFASAFWRVALALPALYAWMIYENHTDGLRSFAYHGNTILYEALYVRAYDRFHGRVPSHSAHHAGKWLIDTYLEVLQLERMCGDGCIKYAIKQEASEDIVR